MKANKSTPCSQIVRNTIKHFSSKVYTYGNHEVDLENDQ